MKSLLAAIVLSPLLVSCTYFMAAVTPVTPVVPRPLTQAELGEFATNREFVTLEPMRFVVSTKSLLSLEAFNAYGPSMEREQVIKVPMGTRLSVTRVVEKGYTDYNWINQKTRVLSGDMVLDGKNVKGVRLNRIAVWTDDAPTYNRKLVAPVSKIEEGTPPRQ